MSLCLPCSATLSMNKNEYNFLCSNSDSFYAREVFWLLKLVGNASSLLHFFLYNHLLLASYGFRSYWKWLSRSVFDEPPCAFIPSCSTEFSSLIQARLILLELLTSANGRSSFRQQRVPLFRRFLERIRASASQRQRLKPSERRSSFPLPRLLAFPHFVPYSKQRSRTFAHMSDREAQETREGGSSRFLV